MSDAAPQPYADRYCRTVDGALRSSARRTAARQAACRVLLLVLPSRALDPVVSACLAEAERMLEHSGYSLLTQIQPARGVARNWRSPDAVRTFALGTFAEHDAASLHAAGVERFLTIPGDDWPGTLIGTQLQVTHLHECRHHRLGFAAPSDPNRRTAVADRTAQAQDAATRLGLAPLLAHTVDHAASAAAAIRDWRRVGVTGVVAFDDDTAAAVVGAALRAGLSVPGDIAVVGHGDSPTAAAFAPTLSSIRIDHIAMARHLVDQLLHENPQTSSSHAHLVTLTARESTLAG
ncbi:substrate-binding domain-containing protein [Nocardia sp. NPDC004123]